MVLRLIDCIHCGYEFQIDIDKRLEEGETAVARGFFNFTRPEKRYVKTIDIICSKCNKTFEYKLES
jgi:hypothetical protein